MSIFIPEKHWWRDPLDKDEKVWLAIALTTSIVLTLAMPYWHVTQKQNPGSEYYKIKPDTFDAATDRFIQQYGVKDEAGAIKQEGGIDVVAPPPGDVFVRGQQFKWSPVLKLKKGSEYRIHLSSIDVLHGFSVQPINMNFEAVPGYDYVLKVTPTTSGVFNIVCNEFCGIGHHTMVGRIYVD